MKVVKKWIEIHSQSRFEAMGWFSSFPSFLALPKVTLLSELRFPRATQVETTGNGSLEIYLALSTITKNRFCHLRPPRVTQTNFAFYSKALYGKHTFPT